jgi:hypothetical protein
MGDLRARPNRMRSGALETGVSHEDGKSYEEIRTAIKLDWKPALRMNRDAIRLDWKPA